MNKKIAGITLAGFTGILFISMLFFQTVSDFRSWPPEGYMVLFTFLFIILGSIYSSSSFPAFRSKEKSLTYLMLPATASEKFVFEFLSRIVLFILVMPLLYFIVVSLETALVHYCVPDFEPFSISKIPFDKFSDFSFNDGAIKGSTGFTILGNALFVILLFFAGASHFVKSPLRKTLLAITIIYAAYALFIFLLMKVINIDQLNNNQLDPINFLNTCFPRNNQHNASLFGIIMITVINLSLLAIAFFKLKEKEA